MAFIRNYAPFEPKVSAPIDPAQPDGDRSLKQVFANVEQRHRQATAVALASLCADEMRRQPSAIGASTFGFGEHG
jgi:hypothetical protein